VVDIPFANLESLLTQIANSDGAESPLNVHAAGPTGLCNFKGLKFNKGTEGETYVCNEPGVSGYISYIVINHHPQISAARMAISIHRISIPIHSSTIFNYCHHISRCNHKKRKPPLTSISFDDRKQSGRQPTLYPRLPAYCPIMLGRILGKRSIS
jgi:hypothetical protein